MKHFFSCCLFDTYRCMFVEMIFEWWLSKCAVQVIKLKIRYSQMVNRMVHLTLCVRYSQWKINWCTSHWEGDLVEERFFSVFGMQTVRHMLMYNWSKVLSFQVSLQLYKDMQCSVLCSAHWNISPSQGVTKRFRRWGREMWVERKLPINNSLCPLTFVLGQSLSFLALTFDKCSC